MPIVDVQEGVADLTIRPFHKSEEHEPYGRVAWCAGAKAPDLSPPVGATTHDEVKDASHSESNPNSNSEAEVKLDLRVQVRVRARFYLGNNRLSLEFV